MPIYEYRATGDANCARCAPGFERLHKRAEPELDACPECGAPVQRVASTPNLGGNGPSLDPGNLEQHGFTQYKKSGKGTYEKTAGLGPRTITDD